MTWMIRSPAPLLACCALAVVSPRAAHAQPGLRTERTSALVASVGPEDLTRAITSRPVAFDEREGAPEPGARPAGAPTRDDAARLIAGAVGSKGATPGPSLEVDTDLVGNDPQIAVSPHYVVVTSYAWLEVYDKSGHRLGGKNGKPFANPFSTLDLYKPLWKPGSATSVNAHLNLPAGMKCDPNGDITAADRTPTKYCIDEFYDTRVTYDVFRKRFWVVSLARNTAARGVTDPSILMGRRSYMIAAVSKTEDPRDGFYMLAWPAAAGEGACNIPADVACPGSYYHPGDAGDYPWVTITSQYVVTTVNVNNVISDTGRYANVHVLRAASLAHGSCNGCQWSLYNIPDEDGNVLRGGLKPAQELTDAGFPLLAANTASSIEVFALRSDASGPIGFYRAAAALGRDFVTAADAPLPHTTATMTLNNIRSITGLAYRSSYLYVAMQDCAPFLSSYCTDGVRLIRINVHTIEDHGDLPNDTGSGFFDMTIGLRAADDPPDAVVDFGIPDVTLTKNGDIVLVYVRAGETVYPEVRYTILYDAETLPRSPKLLRRGSFAATGNLDTAGIALDPSDHATVWMAHGFGDSTASWFRVAMGKVRP